MFPHKLMVLRHGQTEWNAKDRLQGKHDSPLTALGVSQARRQAELLADMDLTGTRLLVSPQGRARQTAGIALGDRADQLEVEERLREIDVGDWTGVHMHELWANHPEIFDKGRDFVWYDHAPNGEGLAGLEARVTGFLSDLKGPALLVTHGITSRMIRALALGGPASRFAEVPGGQGVIHIVEDGRHETLS